MGQSQTHHQHTPSGSQVTRLWLIPAQSPKQHGDIGLVGGMVQHNLGVCMCVLRTGRPWISSNEHKKQGLSHYTLVFSAALHGCLEVNELKHTPTYAGTHANTDTKSFKAHTFVFLCVPDSLDASIASIQNVNSIDTDYLA